MQNITPTEMYSIISYTYTLSPLQGLIISRQDKSYNVLKQVFSCCQRKKWAEMKLGSEFKEFREWGFNFFLKEPLCICKPLLLYTRIGLLDSRVQK
jgi:hypothetical protein